jgi:hypothetical protein
MARLGSALSRWILELSSAPRSHVAPRAVAVSRAPEVELAPPTAAEAREIGFRWDAAAQTAWLDVDPWRARITLAGSWINVSIERPPDEVLDRAVPAFDAFAALPLRSSLAGGMEPVFVADGPLVMALGMLRDEAFRRGAPPEAWGGAPSRKASGHGVQEPDRVADRVLAVRRLLEEALDEAARHPDPRVGRRLGRSGEREAPRDSPLLRRVGRA